MSSLGSFGSFGSIDSIDSFSSFGSFSSIDSIDSAGACFRSSAERSARYGFEALRLRSTVLNGGEMLQGLNEVQPISNGYSFRSDQIQLKTHLNKIRTLAYAKTLATRYPLLMGYTSVRWLIV